MPNLCVSGAPMLSARMAVRNLKEYHPPVGDRVGLRLDFNENTQGASPLVLEELYQLDAESLARYPDREPVEREVAAFLGLAPAEILLTNGVDEAIHLLCQTYLEAGCEAIVAVPAFPMYELFAAGSGAAVIPVMADDDFRFPTDGLLSAITSRTRLIAVANPNNPTGAKAPSQDLLAIAAAAPEAAVLVDEAYFEFCGETIVRELANNPNVFVARTFSKAYGIAGLRIGVLAGSVSQMQMVRKVASPYNVNAVALAVLPAALRYQDYLARYVCEVLSGRERLEDWLKSRGIRYWPSHANFVLVDFGSLAQAVVRAMWQRGILVRDRSSDPGCAGCVRITLGTNSDTDRLLLALEEALRQVDCSRRAG
jgi:histidinol-phosphate aminotransferase